MITAITLTYNRSGGCWTIAAYDGRTMVHCKSHYGLKRQAQAWAKRAAASVALANLVIELAAQQGIDRNLQ